MGLRGRDVAAAAGPVEALANHNGSDAFLAHT